MTKWDEKLRQRMEEHKKLPPSDLWKEIEASIAISPMPVKKVGGSYWIKRSISIAAILLIVLGASYLVWHRSSINNKESIYIVSDKDLDTIPQYIYNTLNDNLYTESNAEDEADNKTTVKQTSSSKTNDLANNYTLVKTTSNSKNDSNNDNQEQELDTDTNLNKQDKGTRIEEQEDKENSEEKTAKRKPALLPAKKNKSSLQGMNLYAASASTDYATRENSSPQLMNTEPAIFFRDDPISSIEEHNLYREVVTKTKHKLPFKLGASLSFAFGDRWRLVTGVTYTKLSSDLFSGSDVYYYIGEQTLHYIGIPVAIKYDFWEYNGFSVYGGIGGTLEKNVSGTQKTDYTLKGKKQMSKSEHISIDPLQVSMQLSFGLQYNISKRIGVYVEPSMGYYFKSNNKIETIYQKRPLNLDLKVGFNLNLGE